MWYRKPWLPAAVDLQAAFFWRESATSPEAESTLTVARSRTLSSQQHLQSYCKCIILLLHLLLHLLLINKVLKGLQGSVPPPPTTPHTFSHFLTHTYLTGCICKQPGPSDHLSNPQPYSNLFPAQAEHYVMPQGASKCHKLLGSACDEPTALPALHHTHMQMCPAAAARPAHCRQASATLHQLYCHSR
jgi:hypothetical protein